MLPPSNFAFLLTPFPDLHTKATRAEARATVEPVSSASYARLALEELLYHVYDAEQLELDRKSTRLNSSHWW